MFNGVTNNKKIYFKGQQNSPFDFQITGSEFHIPTELTFEKKIIPQDITSQDKIKNYFLNKVQENLRVLMDKILDGERGRDLYSRVPSINSVLSQGKDFFQEWFLNEENGEKLTLSKQKEPKKNYNCAHLKEIFNNSKIVDISERHDQVLDVYKVASEEARIKQDKPITLIHFDTHSDMKDKNDNIDYGISVWVNSLIKNYNVTDVYWVLPDWTKKNQVNSLFWAKDDKMPNYIDETFNLMPPEFSIYKTKRAKDPFLFFKKPKGYEHNKDDFSEIKIHKRIMEELPDFNGAKNIHLDFCGDYFGNRGFSTIERTNYNYTKEGLNNLFCKVTESLYEKGVRPFITTMALSREFVPPEDVHEIKHFWQEIVKSSGKGDYLIGYKHADPKKSSVPLMERINAKREPRKLFRTLYELDCADKKSERPDDSIDLTDQTSKEFKEALEAVKRGFVIKDEGLAQTILKRSDKLDGKIDGKLNLIPAEELVSQKDIQL
jgi:hypothetical protein